MGFGLVGVWGVGGVEGGFFVVVGWMVVWGGVVEVGEDVGEGYCKVDESWCFVIEDVDRCDIFSGC